VKERKLKTWKKDKPEGPTEQQERKGRNQIKGEEQTTEPYLRTA
jgi:hypothetical protein